MELAFFAKWRVEIVTAKNIGGTWMYSIDKNFIPVNEVSKPYYLDHLPDTQAILCLHASTAVDLLPSYNGVNLNFSAMVMQPGSFDKRFFNVEGATATTPDVEEGDSLLVLIPSQQ